MKKIFFLIFITTFLVIGCQKKDNQLIMVTEAGFAPYEYYENNKIIGVDVEIAKEIANYLGKELIIKDIFFDSIINELKSGKADIGLAGMTITEERLKEVDFSIEYVKSRQIVIVRKDSNIKNIENIYDKNIAVQLGCAADYYLTENYPDTKIIRQKKYLTMIEDLKASKVDSIIMDELPAQQILKTTTNLKILDGYVFEDSYGIAVKKGNQELLNNINIVLNRLIIEGKIKEYIIKYTK